VTRALLRRLLRLHVGLLAACTAGLFAFIIVLIKVGEAFETEPGGIGQMLSILPKFIKDLLGDQAAYASFDGLVAFGFQHPACLAVTLGYACVAASAPSAELESGLADVLLARPVSRARYLAAHLAHAGLAALLMAGTALLGATVGLSLVAIEEPLPWHAYVPAALAMAAFILAVVGLMLLSSSFGRRRGPAVARVVGVLVVSLLLDMSAQLWPALETIAPVALFHWFRPIELVLDPESTWAGPAVLLGVFALSTAGAFWPRPKVNSAIVKIVPKPTMRKRIVNREFYHDYLRRTFHHRRKLLRSVLVGMYRKQLGKTAIDDILQKQKLKPTVRAEEMTIRQHIELGNRLFKATLDIAAQS